MRRKALMGITVSMIALALFGCAGSHAENNTETAPEPLVIDTPEPCTTGKVTVYDVNGGTYFSCSDCTIDIINDGRDGEDMEIIVTYEGSWPCECSPDD